jgi:hypothetical protein
MEQEDCFGRKDIAARNSYTWCTHAPGASAGECRCDLISVSQNEPGAPPLHTPASDER